MNRMNRQRIYKLTTFDVEKTIVRIEEAGDAIIDYEGTSGWVIRPKCLPGVTIQVITSKKHEPKLLIYYDDELHKEREILNYVHNTFVDSDGKPVTPVFIKENRNVRQNIRGVIGLVEKPLEMRSPRGDIVAIRVKSGTICGSIVPSDENDWLPLNYTINSPL